MKNWLKNLLRITTPGKKQPEAAQPDRMPDLPPAQAAGMLQMIEKTQAAEISCDEALRLLGQFAEMSLRGEDTASLLPLVHQHLELCPDCREEFDALMNILQASLD